MCVTNKLLVPVWLCDLFRQAWSDSCSGASWIRISSHKWFDTGFNWSQPLRFSSIALTELLLSNHIYACRTKMTKASQCHAAEEDAQETATQQRRHHGFLEKQCHSDRITITLPVLSSWNDFLWSAGRGGLCYNPKQSAGATNAYMVLTFMINSREVRGITRKQEVTEVDRVVTEWLLLCKCLDPVQLDIIQTSRKGEALYVVFFFNWWPKGELRRLQITILPSRPLTQCSSVSFDATSSYMMALWSNH